MNTESAFPYSHQYPAGHPAYSDGMTLRDYFAIAALRGLLANGEMGTGDRVVHQAYRLADAMLRERNKEKN